MTLTWWFLACATVPTSSPPSDFVSPVEAKEAAPPEPALPEVGLPAAPLPPGLESRIEGPSSAGECGVDADCATAGCAGEVCVAGARASEVITTCEVLPIFSELSACGCQGGICTWTRAPGARPLGLLRPLPERLGEVEEGPRE
jgi:eight-cysteine-cluster-containing protein